MQPEEVQRLIEKYLHNNASEEERQKLLLWYQSESSKDAEWDLDDFESEEHLKNEIYDKIIRNRDISVQPKRRNLFYQISAAASIIILLASGLYFYSDRKPVAKIAVKKTLVEPKRKAKPADIPPGGHKAILTLADGTKIVLDDAKMGVLARQAGIKVHKNTHGIIEYTVTNETAQPDSQSAIRTVYNTIQTPVGGRYQLNLADGSKVWLNSSSSLRYPISFSGDSREVHLKGEAYFEVSRDQSRKFSVRSGNQSVEVLGTHFNINAYPDEPSINTTLLEGKVRVIELSSRNSQLLKPGERSEVRRDILVMQTDPQAAVAWKEGYFHFKNADIQTVMRQLSRWYGVSPRYEGTMPKQTFAGAIATNLTLLQVLEILENTNIRFRLEGKEVVVMP